MIPKKEYWVQCEFAKHIVNLRNKLFRIFTLNPLFVFWNNNEFTIYSANSPWLHYSLFVLQIDFESTIFYILLISRIHDNFTIFPSNELSFSWNHYEFTICFSILLLCFANYVKIHYRLHEITFNSLSFSRNHHEFTIFSLIYLESTIVFAKSL